LHPAELGPPLVKSGVTETAFAAQLLDRHTRIGFPQKPMICSSVNLLFFMPVILLDLTDFANCQVVRAVGSRSAKPASAELFIHTATRTQPDQLFF
jgi:hypothetical protein